MDHTIESRVTEVLIRVLSVSHGDSVPDLQTTLIGDMGMGELDFVYMIAELMDEFGIRFDAADFENYRFNTPEAIISCVKKHLEK